MRTHKDARTLFAIIANGEEYRDVWMFAIVTVVVVAVPGEEIEAGPIIFFCCAYSITTTCIIGTLLVIE